MMLKFRYSAAFRAQMGPTQKLGSVLISIDGVSRIKARRRLSTLL
jgi:hypothetical protein